MKTKLAYLLLLLLIPAGASAQVTQQWAALYNGPGNGRNTATSIAVDSGGNVYVTGFSDGGATGLDYATIKYNSAGTQLWVQRFNGSGNGDDVPAAIAVDAAGNVYVTGYSYSGPATGYDYATISYDTNGNQRWVMLYNGSTNLDDFANALVLDAFGNVVVTGGTNVVGGLDYGTVAYDPTTGAQLWVALYSGGAGDDIANAITADGLGNVYVTGQSTGFGTGFDYLTVAYDSTGAQIYASRYNGPASGDDVAQGIAVDGAGNAFVTGYSLGAGTGFDFATVAYDLTGAQLWLARYDGPASGYDLGNSVVFDPIGFVYVTGSSQGIGTNLDYATIQYDPATGTQNWVQRYDGPASSLDEPYKVTVDGTGNIYVTGYSFGVGTGYDYATLSYDSTGVQRWVRRYDGFGADDVADALTVDSLGNVYVTGYATSGTGRNFATVKYSQP